MPFSSFIGKDTLKKYCGVWEQLLYYIYYMQKDNRFEEAKPSYQFTYQQEDAFSVLVRVVDDIGDKTEEAGRLGS